MMASEIKRSGPRVAPDIRTAVLAALSAGLDDTAIARMQPISRPTVAKLRRAIGVAPIASRWGERSHVKRGAAAQRRSLEPAFRTLYDTGLGDRAIGRQLGCDHQSVRRWRRAAGLRAVGMGGRPRTRVATKPFVSISPHRHPLYAAAVEAARTAGTHPDTFDDLVSDLVVAVLANEIAAPTSVEAGRRRRSLHEFGRATISLDARLFDDSGATLMDRLAATIDDPVLFDGRGVAR